MFLLDPKRNNRVNDVRHLPLMEKSIYEQVGVLFKDPPIFRPESDMLLMFDGRVPTHTTYIKNVMKVGIDSKVLPARGSVCMRLMHHNREFGPGGHFRSRKGSGALNPNLPDPLESLHILAGSARWRALPHRQRQTIDLPGDNGSRGWQGLSLRQLRELEINQVSQEIKDLILGNSEGGEVAGQSQDLQQEEPTETTTGVAFVSLGGTGSIVVRAALVSVPPRHEYGDRHGGLDTRVRCCGHRCCSQRPEVRVLPHQAAPGRSHPGDSGSISICSSLSVSRQYVLETLFSLSQGGPRPAC